MQEAQSSLSLYKRKRFRGQLLMPTRVCFYTGTEEESREKRRWVLAYMCLVGA